MKRVVALVLLVALTASASAAAAEGKRAGGIRPGLFELGLNLGEPTGVSAKLWLDRTNAVEGIAAWAFTQGAIALCVDYLYSFPDLLNIRGESFPLFIGIGGVVRFSAPAGGPAQAAVGLRIPVGVLYAFREVPLELSLDIVPGLNIFPDTVPIAMGGLGVRYCF